MLVRAAPLGRVLIYQAESRVVLVLHRLSKAARALCRVASYALLASGIGILPSVVIKVLITGSVLVKSKRIRLGLVWRIHDAFPCLGIPDHTHVL